MIFIASYLPPAPVDNHPIPQTAPRSAPLPLDMEDAENVAATAWLQWRGERDFERFCEDRHASATTLTAYPNGTFSISSVADGTTTEWHFRPFDDAGRLLPPLDLDQGTNRWKPHASILLQYARHLNRPIDRHSVGISRVNGLTVERILERTGPVNNAVDRIKAASSFLKVFSSIYGQSIDPDSDGNLSPQTRFNFDLEKFSRRFETTIGLRDLGSWILGAKDDMSALATLKIIDKLATVIAQAYATHVDLGEALSERQKPAFRRAFRQAVLEGSARDGIVIDATTADFAANALVVMHRLRLRMEPLGALPTPPAIKTPPEHGTPAVSSPLPVPPPDADSTPFVDRPVPRPPSAQGTTTYQTERWVRVAEIMTLHGTILVFTATTLATLTASQKAAIAALGSGIAAAGATVLAVVIPGAASAASAVGSTAIFYSNIVDYLISRGVAPQLAKSAAVIEIGGVYVLVGVGTVQSGQALSKLGHHPSWRNALSAVGHIIATLGTLGAGASSADKADKYNIEDARYGFFEKRPELPGKLEHAGSGASVVGVGTLYTADNIPSTPEEDPSDEEAHSFWKAVTTLLSYWDPSPTAWKR